MSDLLKVELGVDNASAPTNPKVELIIPQTYTITPNSALETSLSAAGIATPADQQKFLKAEVRRAVEEALADPAINLISASKNIAIREDASMSSDLGSPTSNQEVKLTSYPEFEKFVGIITGSGLQVQDILDKIVHKLSNSVKTISGQSVQLIDVTASVAGTIDAYVAPAQPKSTDYFPESNEAQLNGWDFDELDDIWLDRVGTPGVIDFKGPLNLAIVEAKIGDYINRLSPKGKQFGPNMLVRMYSTESDRRAAVADFDKMMLKAIGAIYIIINKASSGTGPIFINQPLNDAEVEEYIEYVIEAFTDARRKFIQPLTTYFPIDVGQEFESIANANPALKPLADLSRNFGRAINERLIILELNSTISRLHSSLGSGSYDLRTPDGYERYIVELGNLVALARPRYDVIVKSATDPYTIQADAGAVIPLDVIRGNAFHTIEMKALLDYATKGIIVDGSGEMDLGRYHLFLEKVYAKKDQGPLVDPRNETDKALSQALIERVMIVLVPGYARLGKRFFRADWSPFDANFDADGMFLEVGEHKSPDTFDTLQSMIRVLKVESLKTAEPNFCKALYERLKKRLNDEKARIENSLKGKSPLTSDDIVILTGIDEVMIMIDYAEKDLPALDFNTFAKDLGVNPTNPDKVNDRQGNEFLARRFDTFSRDYEKVAEKALEAQKSAMEADRNRFAQRIRNGAPTGERELLQQRKDQSQAEYEALRQRNNQIRETMAAARVAVRNLNTLTVKAEKSESTLERWKAWRTRFNTLRAHGQVIREASTTGAVSGLFAGIATPLAVGTQFIEGVGFGGVNYGAASLQTAILAGTFSGGSLSGRSSAQRSGDFRGANIVDAARDVRRNRLVIIEDEYNKRQMEVLNSKDNIYRMRANLILLVRMMDAIGKNLRPIPPATSVTEMQRLTEYDKVWAQIAGNMGMQTPEAVESTYQGIAQSLDGSVSNIREVTQRLGGNAFREEFNNKREEQRKRRRRYAANWRTRLADRDTVPGKIFRTMELLFA